jgi:hypothetical protein
MWQDKVQENEEGTETVSKCKNTYVNYGIISAETYNKNNSDVYNTVSSTSTIQGYSNTLLIIEKYNKEFPYSTHVTKVTTVAGVDYLVKSWNDTSILVVKELSSTSITNASAWYVPSYKEMDVLFKEYNTANSALKKLLKETISVEYSGCYWSSTEDTGSSKYSYDYYSYTESYAPKKHNTDVYYSSKAYLFDNSSGAGTPVLCDKFATTYNSKTINVLSICAF